MTPDWTAFFAPPAAGLPRRFRVLSRQGNPFLWLPPESTAARGTLSLYPAQTLSARLLKTALGWGLCGRLPLPGPQISLPLNDQSSFARFLAGLMKGGATPLWGVFGGNPHAPGRRFLFLLFDRTTGTPVALVKAGLAGPAAALVSQEAAALDALPESLQGRCPKLGFWKDLPGCAVALPFIPGKAPRSANPLPALLENWLAHGSEGRLAEIAGWQTVSHLRPPMEDRLVHAPVAHGDLAPWNIREHDGQWTIIDWERGTPRGVPGWDWFHYTLQPGVLVRKWDAERLVAEAKALLASPAFRRYAQAARIDGLERTLLLGYLLHCTEVIRQTEGAEALRGARVRLEREGEAVGVERRRG